MDKKLIYIAAAVLCIIAVFPLPYGYYTFLRISVSIIGCIAAFDLVNKGNQLWVIFAGIVILFNPLIPIHLSRDLWVFIDLVVAGLFGGQDLINMQVKIVK